MSLDLVENGQMISVVESSAAQKGPRGSRLILGPFRFVNHDCEPNCQVSAMPLTSEFTEENAIKFKPINGTHACMIWSLQNIEPGSSITVCYTKDDTYFSNGPCLCTTCTGHPIAAPCRPRPQLLEMVPHGPEKKRACRGGRRERVRKRGIEANHRQAGHNTEGVI